MVEENEYKTFTVGVTHFVSPSSPFRDWLNPGICSRRTVRTASGESHDWRVGRSGWEARSFFVFRLYVSNAALKTETKLDCEVDVEGTADMMVRGEGGNRRVGAQQAHVPPETRGRLRQPSESMACRRSRWLPSHSIYCCRTVWHLNLNRLWISECRMVRYLLTEFGPKGMVKSDSNAS